MKRTLEMMMAAVLGLMAWTSHAGSVTVSGRINDGNNSAVLGATCTIEFASYDGETIITTQSNPYNDAAYSADLPSDKKYRVWCMQHNGSICGEAILDLNGVTGPVTDQNYGMHSPLYCVTYDGGTRIFLSLDFAEAFIARTPSAESLVTVKESGSSIREMLVGRDWIMSPVIALRSAASSDVYAFLKPMSADASNFVECVAFTNGVKISAGATTPENAVTMSLKDTVADGQSIKLSYEVELRATNDATAPVLTTPKATLSTFENYLAVVGKTDDVEVTYDGEGHFITVNTNGLSRVITNGDNTSLEEVSVRYSYGKDGSYQTKKRTPTLTNACVQAVYYTIGNSKAYVNQYIGFATVTIKPGDLTKTDFEVVTNGENTVKILKLKDGATLTDGALVIPETIGGCAVTEIAEMAFSGNQTITKITIPKTVTTIGNWAFANCQKVMEIIVLGEPENVGEEIFRRAGIDNANGKQLVVRADETWFNTNIDALRNTTVANGAVTTNDTSAIVMSVNILGLSSATPGTWTIDFSIEKLSRKGTINASNVIFLYRASLMDTPTELTAQSLTDNGDETYSATITMPEGGGTAPSGFFMIKYKYQVQIGEE